MIREVNTLTDIRMWHQDVDVDWLQLQNRSCVKLRCWDSETSRSVTHACKHQLKCGLGLEFATGLCDIVSWWFGYLFMPSISCLSGLDLIVIYDCVGCVKHIWGFLGYLKPAFMELNRGASAQRSYPKEKGFKNPREVFSLTLKPTKET